MIVSMSWNTVKFLIWKTRTDFVAFQLDISSIISCSSVFVILDRQCSSDFPCFASILLLRYAYLDYSMFFTQFLALSFLGNWLPWLLGLTFSSGCWAEYIYSVCNPTHCKTIIHRYTLNIRSMAMSRLEAITILTPWTTTVIKSPPSVANISCKKVICSHNIGFNSFYATA